MGPCAECRKLCEGCGRAVWPYLFAAFLATFVGFITWLVLMQAGIPQDKNLWLSSAASVGTLVLLLAYMVACIRRHCPRRRVRSTVPPMSDLPRNKGR